MKLCRFDRDRLGLVLGEHIVEVTDLFDLSPTWPLPAGDWIIRQAVEMGEGLAARATGRPKIPLGDVRLESPVANPGKIIGAPINYRAHIAEAHADQGIGFGRSFADLKEHGLFLKAPSALIGPSDDVQLRFPERRSDHEVERALEHVFGYAIGLDMTVRGPEWPVFRKSGDTYAVLGPWIVTADEIADPNALSLSLRVNGELRQSANTAQLIYDLQALIEYASSFYTLHPGDLIYTGTPEGVSQVLPGDVMDCEIEYIGRMHVGVAKAWFSEEPAADGGAASRPREARRY
jgi:2-keto-4-pentenoate hydratase/2-oxohepta-3-ene-1,7-dioic acid hydratase in catechol pathway